MVTINAVCALTRDGNIALITVDSPPVNALSYRVRDGMYAALTQANADETIDAIVIRCAGRTFFAGADISEFRAPPRGVPLSSVLQAIESSPKPVVAAIHGTALGGGLEVALSTHYRVAVPSAKFGLPEVTIGLLPGAGGTQRLPRLVGVETALEMIAFGGQIGAATALEAGLIDMILPEDDLVGASVAFLRNELTHRRPLPRVRDRDEKITPARLTPEIFDTFRKDNAHRFRGFEAPEAIVAAVQAAVRLPFEEGIAEERRHFQQLAAGDQAAAQQYAFFAERAAAKVADIPADTATRPITRVGIIGAGTMGSGIAMSFANAGIAVVMVEREQSALERGLATIRRNYENTVKKGRLTQLQMSSRIGLLDGTVDIARVADCDMVIEAVYEDLNVKQAVFRQLDRIAKPGAILATNTSYLDIDRIADCVERPESVIGTHFFSPANVMRLLEIVRGAKTSADVIATAMALAKKLGKVGVLVGVCHGFVGNRMLWPRQAQAQAMTAEGAMPWDIDHALYDFGFPMGPFAMSDLAGLDIGWSRQTSSSSTLREILCEMGRLGQKTGAGFYDYDENRKATPSPVTQRVVREFATRSGVTARQLSEQEIIERTIYPMINEGAKILEEGKAARASDIDVIWLYGYGWPRYRGGPMYYAGTVGLAKIVECLETYRARYGDSFKPARLLRRLAAEGKTFNDT